MRTFITILFAFVAISGPWLCCCTPAAVLAAAPHQSPKPLKSATGCPHCKIEIASNVPAEPLPVAPCPCQKYESPEMLPATLKASLAISLESLPPVLTLDTPMLVQTITHVTAAVVTSDRPFLTTAMRLYTHHALLC